jgi:hypothetical protein
VEGCFWNAGAKPEQEPMFNQLKQVIVKAEGKL